MKNREPKEQIVRRIYLSYPTAVFRDYEDNEFEILNEIASFFKIPFTSVQIVGSAKTGYSLVNDRPFIEKKSDCDIAIIDFGLYINLIEYAHRQTKGFSDYTKYDQRTYWLANGFSKSDKLKKDICQGYINPYYLPNGDLKESWLRFFEKMSEKYSDKFRTIDGAAYASQYLFEMKQCGAIDKFLGGGKGNATV
jgi:hypothetical protein